MHTFLPSIGFPWINTWSDEAKLLKFVTDSPDQVKMAQMNSESRSLAVYEKHFSADGRIGIRAFGIYENGSFSCISYLPYADNPQLSLKEPCELTKAGDGERLLGSVDDYRMGLLIIFTVSNYGRLALMEDKEKGQPKVRGIRLTGLGREGRILMPVRMSREQQEYHHRIMETQGDLSKAAREGDQEAANEFYYSDYSIASDARKRLSTEDLYSVVNTAILPVGVECDQYQVVAQIKSVETILNEVSGAELYYLRVRINTLHAVICIPKSEVKGVPKAGRRIKCQIWLIGEAVVE